MNNPQLIGSKLETVKFHLNAGRMGEGDGTAKLELFLNQAKSVSSIDFQVNQKANASRMTMGQERDAIPHPGQESFDGEIARFLIWDRPPGEDELAMVMELLRATYFNK